MRQQNWYDHQPPSQYWLESKLKIIQAYITITEGCQEASFGLYFSANIKQQLFKKPLQDVPQNWTTWLSNWGEAFAMIEGSGKMKGTWTIFSRKWKSKLSCCNTVGWCKSTIVAPELSKPLLWRVFWVWVLPSANSKLALYFLQNHWLLGPSSPILLMGKFQSLFILTI